jgi:hypothetical protein
MWMRMWTVWLCCSCSGREEPYDLGHCSHLHMGSLWSNQIGDEGARDLGAALQVNATLTTLGCGCACACGCGCGGVVVLQSQ